MTEATCPICGKTCTEVHARVNDIEYFTSDATYNMMKCTECDVLFVDPMLKDRLNFIYPENYYSFTGTTKKNWVVAIKEWLDRRGFRALTASLSGRELSVLDIGGGTGWLVDQLKELDPRFTSSLIVDIDEGAHQHAVAKGHDFFLGKFEDLPVSERRFDLILMLNIIEHVSDPKLVLEKAAALLAPGGKIWVKTPNFDSLDARLFRHRSWGGYHAPRHFVLFNRSSFDRLAQGAGLTTLEFSYTQGAPFWAISLLDILRRKGLATVSAARPSIYHPLTPILQAAAAAFDFGRAALGGRPSQMVAVLGSEPSAKVQTSQ